MTTEEEIKKAEQEVNRAKKKLAEAKRKAQKEKRAEENSSKFKYTCAYYNNKYTLSTRYKILR